MKKGKAIQNKVKLNNFKKELQNKGSIYYYLFLIGFNLGIKLEDLIKLSRDKAEKIINEKKNDIIDKEKLSQIKNYIKNFEQDQYIFPEKHLQLSEVYQILKDVAQKAGIKDFGTETLQRSYAYFHYQRFQDIDRIKDILNLVSPTAALHYMGYEDDRYLCFHCNRGCIYRKKYK